MDESFYNWVENPNCEEGIFWDSWLKDHPDKINDADRAKKLLKAISFKDRAFQKKEITELWDRIKADSIEKNGVEHEVNNFNPWKYLKVAAVILPFIIAAVLFLFFREMPNEDQVAAPALIEKYNPKGQKLTVFLSDGSRIKLNAESKLSYLKPFSSTQRIVQLEGEAFFEVTPDKTRPFIVKSGNLETKVVGTSFNVKAYPGDDNIKVAVKTGMVSVENKNQKLTNQQNRAIVLSPAEMATFSEETNITTVTGYNPEEILGWRDDILYFENASMDEFVTEIERWYDVDIVVDRSEPIAKGITGLFKDQSLEEILEGTKGTSEFEYEFLSNGKIIIK